MIWVTEKGFKNDDILQCILDAVARAEAEQEKDTQPVEPVEASTKIPHASKVSNCCKKQASPSGYYIPEVVAIYSNRPYTTVLWKDGTKTIVKCSEDSHFTEYDGFVCAFAKKAFGNNTALKEFVKEHTTYQGKGKKGNEADA